MTIEIKVPEVGESISEGMIAEWKKQDGDLVNEGDELFELETDKITMPVNSQHAGKLSIKVEAGEVVSIGQVVAIIDTSVKVEPTPEITPPAGVAQLRDKTEPQKDLADLAPSVRRLVEEHKLQPSQIKGTGKQGRITKEDVLQFVEHSPQEKPTESFAQAQSESPPPQPERQTRQTRTPITPLRQRVSERLVQVQQTAAILTTFNEVDMSAIMDLRNKYKEAYQKKYAIKLGFMSFFVKAVVAALKAVPKVNAQIDGAEIVHNHFYDIGVAVSTDKGLVVPVIRDADRLNFAEIELAIADYAQKAKERKLTLDDLSGGVFTISNGGIFGSLLSTPIINPPQSGILGMHAIKRRPVAVGNNIEIRPMMYLALSYDHRLIDGAEAVTFLVRIVECIENPERIFLEI